MGLYRYKPSNPYPNYKATYNVGDRDLFKCAICTLYRQAEVVRGTYREGTLTYVDVKYVNDDDSLTDKVYKIHLPDASRFDPCLDDAKKEYDRKEWCQNNYKLPPETCNLNNMNVVFGRNDGSVGTADNPRYYDIDVNATESLRNTAWLLTKMKTFGFCSAEVIPNSSSRFDAGTYSVTTHGNKKSLRRDGGRIAFDPEDSFFGIGTQKSLTGQYLCEYKFQNSKSMYKNIHYCSPDNQYLKKSHDEAVARLGNLIK